MKSQKVIEDQMNLEKFVKNGFLYLNIGKNKQLFCLIFFSLLLMWWTVWLYAPADMQKSGNALRV